MADADGNPFGDVRVLSRSSVLKNASWVDAEGQFAW